MNVDDKYAVDRQQLQELIGQHQESASGALKAAAANQRYQVVIRKRRPEGGIKRLTTTTKRWERPRKIQVRSIQIAPPPQNRKSIRPRSRRCRQRL
jgi:hypothetical protein